jgi:hypothetical protein
MTDGPFKSALDHLPSQGVYQHSLVTYKYVSNQLIKVTNTRTYSTDGDYVDTYSSEPIKKGSSV